jgi:outer membrane protein assembly factor BamD (BamD/ComL family)
MSQPPLPRNRWGFANARRIRLRSVILFATIAPLTGCQMAPPLPPPGSHALGSAGDRQPWIYRGQDPGFEPETESDGLLGKWSPKHFYNAAKVAAGYGPNKQIADEAFAAGEALFIEATKLQAEERRERFEEAAGHYETAYKRWPNSALEEDSLFMLSESHFFADAYPDAEKAYELLIKKYPYTRHLDTVDKRRFALAKYWVEHQEAHPEWAITPNVTAKDRPLFDKFGHAIRVFDKIRIDDPTGKLADDATMAAGLAHYKQANYQRADEMFSDLRQSFPDSEHQFQAHLLGLQCKLKIYQGPDYALTPMDEAEVILKQIYRVFPQEAETNREFLKKAGDQVRLNKAQHDWELARYYHRRKEYAAARTYYEQVRKNYSDTNLGREATENLTEIAAEPPKPEQPLPWLADLFPTPDREKPLVARNPLEKVTR